MRTKHSYNSSHILTFPLTGTDIYTTNNQYTAMSFRIDNILSNRCKSFMNATNYRSNN